MSDKLKFRCPGCEKILNIPVQHTGRKVKCPGCGTSFRAGARPTSPSAAPVASPAAPPAGADDFGDELFAKSPGGDQADPFAASDPFGSASSQTAPVANVSRNRSQSAAGLSRRDALSRGKERGQAKQGGLTETDEKLQSSSAFLILLPLIATVLPLFGVQLRRLSKSGEFAPLAAMFLGLIGVGCLVYARRNQGDAPLFGGVSLVFVLICGIGGFFVTAGLQSQNSQAANSRQSSQATSLEEARAISAKQYKSSNKKSGSTTKKKSNSQPVQSQSPIDNERENSDVFSANTPVDPELEKERQQKNAEFLARHAANTAKAEADAQKLLSSMGNSGFGQLRNAGDSNDNPAGQLAKQFGFGNSNDVDDANNNARDSDSASQAENLFAITQNNPAEKDSSNDDSGGDNPFGGNPFATDSTGNDSLESMKNMALESMKNRGRGLTEFVASVPRKSRDFSRMLRRQLKPKVLHRGMEIEVDSGFAISPLSGLQQKLYLMSSYATPIRGVEVIDFGGMKIIPIGKSDSPSPDAIASRSGTRLAGFNLAFSGESIVGIQGVFRSTDELETETTSHWLGQETETVKQIVSEKTVHGFLYYTRLAKPTGFALIVKN